MPCRILKEFAYELAEPVTTIFNASLASGIVPAIWKDSNITPIPKIQSYKWRWFQTYIPNTLFVQGFRGLCGCVDNQFGCLKGTSTSFCLLDMMHTWLSYLDSPNRHLRLSFLDFSKAFDRISHNVLIKKLVDLGLRRCLIPWIISFLSDQRQPIKIGEAFLDWLPVNAGVPQGTKLGPILFLIMINDLSILTPETNLLKFVDDVSISECLNKNGGTSIQSTLDTVRSWASMNLMKLNAKKCKEPSVLL